MRRGHKSGGPEKGFDATPQRSVSLELIEQNKLVKKNGTQDNETSPVKATNRDLSVPFEEILEETIEGFDGRERRR